MVFRAQSSSAKLEVLLGVSASLRVVDYPPDFLVPVIFSSENGAWSRYSADCGVPLLSPGRLVSGIEAEQREGRDGARNGIKS